MPPRSTQQFIALPAGEKLEAVEGQLAHSGRMSRFTGGAQDKKGSGPEEQLHKICCDANKLALEHIKGISGQASMAPALDRGFAIGKHVLTKRTSAENIRAAHETLSFQGPSLGWLLLCTCFSEHICAWSD